MEELLERLVIAVEQQNSAFPWDSVISILALIASWVTIFFLLKERSEKNRPYIDVYKRQYVYIGSGKNGNAVSWGRMKNSAGQ